MQYAPMQQLAPRHPKKGPDDEIQHDYKKRRLGDSGSSPAPPLGLPNSNTHSFMPTAAAGQNLGNSRSGPPNSGRALTNSLNSVFELTLGSSGANFENDLRFSQLDSSFFQRPYESSESPFGLSSSLDYWKIPNLYVYYVLQHPFYFFHIAN